jgi:ketosteroid isomerase-like protein
VTEPDLVQRVAAALDAADLESMRELLAPDARWGAPGDPEPSCRTREQVLSWYTAGREAGVRAHVTEAFTTGSGAIIIGMTVTGRPDDDGTRWQVLTVRAGKIAAIAGFDDRDQALTYAGSGA